MNPNVEAVAEAVRATLDAQDLWACTRDWSAWGHGTMGADDFEPAAGDDDIVQEIAEAVLVALAAKALAGPPPGPCLAPSHPIQRALGDQRVPIVHHCGLLAGHAGGHVFEYPNGIGRAVWPQED